MPEIQRHPADRGMALVTLQAGNKMVGWLANRGAAIVATRTGTGDQVMIEAGGYPAYGRVAFITLCRCLYMRGIFSGCGTAVVTAGTGARIYIDVVEYSRGPGIGCVAVVTGVAAGNVVRGLALRR